MYYGINREVSKRDHEVIRYQARLIDMGAVVGVAEFEAKRKDAFGIAHEDVDPLSGKWVEIKPARLVAPASGGNSRGE